MAVNLAQTFRDEAFRTDGVEPVRGLAAMSSEMLEGGDKNSIFSMQPFMEGRIDKEIARMEGEMSDNEPGAMRYDDTLAAFDPQMAVDLRNRMAEVIIRKAQVIAFDDQVLKIKEERRREDEHMAQRLMAERAWNEGMTTFGGRKMTNAQALDMRMWVLDNADEVGRRGQALGYSEKDMQQYFSDTKTLISISKSERSGESTPEMQATKKEILERDKKFSPLEADIFRMRENSIKPGSHDYADNAENNTSGSDFKKLKDENRYGDSLVAPFKAAASNAGVDLKVAVAVPQAPAAPSNLANKTQNLDL